VLADDALADADAHADDKRRNVRSNEYAVFTCSVFSGSVTSGNIIAPG
jgi:hypothetical protein